MASGWNFVISMVLGGFYFWSFCRFKCILNDNFEVFWLVDFMGMYIILEVSRVGFQGYFFCHFRDFKDILYFYPFIGL